MMNHSPKYPSRKVFSTIIYNPDRVLLEDMVNLRYALPEMRTTGT
jgi:hypothetical protein